MKILVVNGSPKREHSDTMHITRAFLDGMSETAHQDIHVIHVIDRHIEFCTGCFSCLRRPTHADKTGKLLIADREHFCIANGNLSAALLLRLILLLCVIKGHDTEEQRQQEGEHAELLQPCGGGNRGCCAGQDRDVVHKDVL